ncbi:hypothetical protein L1887_48472 [Cichorium endivia]|nr:hypothetical protein L1887_48472 [Cichorium endivia]
MPRRALSLTEPSMVYCCAPAPNRHACVERREQRVDVELGERQVEDEVERRRRREEEDEVDNCKQRGERTRLERHADELGDDVVGGGESGARLVERKDERAGDEHVGERGESEPEDDDHLELLEFLEEEDDLDANRGEEQLGGKGDDAGHDGVGGESAVALGGVGEVAKVGDQILVHEHLVEYGVDRVGDHEEEHKVSHEGLVALEVYIVDVRLHNRETEEPDVEHDADVHATQREVHGGELGHEVRHLV